MTDLPSSDAPRGVFVDQPFPPPSAASGEIPKTLVSRSFKDALAGKSSSSVICSDLKTSTFRGKPAILFSDEQISLLAAPFAFTLVGKFSLRRPSMETIRSFFSRLKLSGSFVVSLLDDRHVSIKLENDLDYSQIFARRVYYVSNCQMRLLKWSPLFDIKEESPVVPVWLAFPNLRLHFINHSVLFAIGSLFGRPLQTDQATASLSRPSVARVLVELDVSKKHPSEVWLGSELCGYFQKIVFENIPLFCSHCKLHGHSLENCFVLHPHLKPNPIKPSRADLGLPEIGIERSDITPMINQAGVGQISNILVERNIEMEDIVNPMDDGNVALNSVNELPVNDPIRMYDIAPPVNGLVEDMAIMSKDSDNVNFLLEKGHDHPAPSLDQESGNLMNLAVVVDAISPNPLLIAQNVPHPCPDPKLVGAAPPLSNNPSSSIPPSDEIGPLRLGSNANGVITNSHHDCYVNNMVNIPSSSQLDPADAFNLEEGEILSSPPSDPSQLCLDSVGNSIVDSLQFVSDLDPDDGFIKVLNSKGKKKKFYVKVPRVTRAASSIQIPNV